jgi:hypothetical protein
MRAIKASHESKEDYAKKYIIHASVSAAVAIIAIELLRRDKLEERKRYSNSNINLDKDYYYYYSSYYNTNEIVTYKLKPSNYNLGGYKRRLAEEIVGAY